MEFIGKAPGVYRTEVFLPLQPRLPTGVPGFVGFVKKTADRSEAARPVALHRTDDFESSFESWPKGYLTDAVRGFFLNEGPRCYVAAVGIDDAWPWDAKAMAEALKGALDSLAPLTDLDLIAVPDAMTLWFSRDSPKLDPEAVRLLQQSVLKHCARNGGRMAILDSMPGHSERDVINHRAALTAGLPEPVNGALYYPWIKMPTMPTTPTMPEALSPRLIPPCGHVAGIFARSDARVGVFKAPANEEVRGALDLERLIDAQTQGLLNDEGINCLRAFAGRGIRVWGARTLSRDPDWRYINVRRLFLTLQRWIDLNLAWASFEPNTPQLWVRITRELSAYLSELWTAGALSGETVDEAFYIKCDSETNPPEVREAGQMITEIGLAPTAPAEFVVVRIVHHTAVEPR